MNYVYDSSFVGALVIPDEKNPKVDKIHKSTNENDALNVPQLFWYELANIFNNLIRRKRFTYERVLQFFPFVNSIRLITDFEYDVNYSQKIFRLCNDYSLSSYDTVYLELAERKKAVLCTLDVNLKNAAKKHGVAVI